MKCPQCQSQSAVYETRQRTENTLRRRECLSCKTRFSTLEVFDGLTGSRHKRKKVVQQVPKQKEKKVIPPVVQRKESIPQRKNLVKDDLDIFFKETEDLSDLGLDIGRGWGDDY